MVHRTTFAILSRGSTSVQASIHCIVLYRLAGPILDELSVLLQQDVSVVSTGTFGGRDIVVFCFQPDDDLVGGLIARGSAFGVKTGHDVVETGYADLCVIRKAERAPANCRRRRGSSVLSSLLIMQ
jgi:hypothetical protein